MKADEIKNLIQEHDDWRKNNCINLIASENQLLKTANDLYLNDMMHRYAEGEPFDRYYQGTEYIDRLEIEVKDLIKELFGVEHTDLRPISGTVANIAACSALKDSGDYLATKMSEGAHLSHSKYGTTKFLGLNETYLPFDEDALQVDPVKGAKKINEVDPDFVILGRSFFLFPEPIEELRSRIEVDTKIIYDAAHVLGLIAGDRFQSPFEEGADVVTSSTHKTFPGPQGGIIMTNNDEDFEKIKKAIFPGMVSNWHSHRLGALGVTALGMQKFGEDYVDQTIKNAQRLGKSLHEKGFDVLGSDRNFTRSHSIGVDMSEHGGGEKVSQELRDNNIILNKNALPGGKPREPNGIRIGTQEMTFMGMKEKQMDRIAEFVYRVLVKSKEVKGEVSEMKKKYTEPEYSI